MHYSLESYRRGPGYKVGGENKGRDRQMSNKVHAQKSCISNLHQQSVLNDI